MFHLLVMSFGRRDQAKVPIMSVLDTGFPRGMNVARMSASHVCGAFGFRCSLFGVRCSVFGVRCSVVGVRCSVFGVLVIAVCIS